MFNEIVEAIDLLYFLADRHQKKRRKRKDWNPSVEYLCDEVGSYYALSGRGLADDGACFSMSVILMVSARMVTIHWRCFTNIMPFCFPE